MLSARALCKKSLLRGLGLLTLLALSIPSAHSATISGSLPYDSIFAGTAPFTVFGALTISPNESLDFVVEFNENTADNQPGDPTEGQYNAITQLDLTSGGNSITVLPGSGLNDISTQFSEIEIDTISSVLFIEVASNPDPSFNASVFRINLDGPPNLFSSDSINRIGGLATLNLSDFGTNPGTNASIGIGFGGMDNVIAYAPLAGTIIFPNSTPPNAAPVAENDIITDPIVSIIPMTLDILTDNGNGPDDFGADGAGTMLPIDPTSGNSVPLGASIATVQGGTVVITDPNGTPNDPTDDVVTYTPPDTGNATVSDSFEYQICDASVPPDCDNATVTLSNVTTPITLGYFKAERGVNPGDVIFTWQTVTEVGNLGFNLYVGEDNGEDRTWRKINAELIPSQLGDSVETQTYSYTAMGVKGERFALGDVDVYVKETLHGPLRLGKGQGVDRSQRQATDWKAVKTEHKAKRKARKAKRQRKIERKLQHKMDATERQLRRQMKQANRQRRLIQ